MDYKLILYFTILMFTIISRTTIHFIVKIIQYLQRLNASNAKLKY